MPAKSPRQLFDIANLGQRTAPWFNAPSLTIRLRMRGAHHGHSGWRTKALAVSLLLALMAPAYAGPPFVTDDPEPVDVNRWEINFGLTSSRAESARAGMAPGIDINYGIARGVQLHAQPQMAYSCESGSCTHGRGDTEIGIKYRFTAPSDNRSAWTAGIYPMLTVPTGDPKRNLGQGAYSLYLPLWVQTMHGCVIQPNWTPKPRQTGHAVQRKLDMHSTPNWTLRAQRRGVEVGFYS